MPPEALGAAHAECWRATDEMVEVALAGGHLDAHRGPPDDSRVKSPARRGDQGSVAWI